MQIGFVLQFKKTIEEYPINCFQKSFSIIKEKHLVFTCKNLLAIKNCFVIKEDGWSTITSQIYLRL